MKVTDPVCGMTIDEEAAVGTHVHNGKTYHFCSDSCRSKFIASPAQYVTEAAAGEHNHDPGHVHTAADKKD